MYNWKQKITAGAAGAAAAFSLLTTGAFASTDVQVSGNGAFSENDVNVSQSNSTNLTQSNNTNVENNVTTVANTGGVFAGFNTGGDVTVRTGDADATTNIRVEGGSNEATIDGCCTGLTDVRVTGNGAFSENDVDVDSRNRTDVRQSNNTNVENNITNVANTGGVSAGFNTGGDVDVRTGDAHADTTVRVDGGRNHLEMSGGSTNNGGSDIRVSGNGAFSENDVDVDTDSDVTIRQDNRTDVENNITNVANTGGVSAGFNTGGDVDVRTGDADATTDVRVYGSTNELDLSGCAWCGSGSTDIWVSGNGAFSENNVRVESDNDRDVRQNNRSDTANNVTTLANSGGVFTSGYGGKYMDDRKHSFDNKYHDMYRKLMDQYDHMMYKVRHEYDRNHHGNKKQNDYGYHHKYDDFDKDYHKNGDDKYRDHHDKKLTAYYSKPNHKYQDYDRDQHSNKHNPMYTKRHIGGNYDYCGRDNNNKHGYKKGYDEKDSFKHAWMKWYLDNYYPDSVFGGQNGSGYVFAGFNTGGDVYVQTGDATAETVVTTTGNSNELRS